MAKRPFPRAKQAREVQLDKLLELMTLINEHGDPAAFARLVRDNNISVVAPPEAINAVKEHIHEHGIDQKNKTARSALKSRYRIDPITGTPTCF